MSSESTVLCVLKTGGEYRAEHAERLRSQVLEHSDAPFVCLTDDQELLDRAVSWTRPLAHNWPGWWSKIEALVTPGPCLYLDLDVTIQRPLTPLLDAAKEHEFIICQDFWVLGPHVVNSSIMGWRGSAPLECATKFAIHAPQLIDEYKTMEKWGDQAYIRDYGPQDRVYWQDIVPNYARSMRGTVWSGPLPDENTIIAVYTGEQKPWKA